MAAKKIWNVAIVGPGWVAGAYVDAFRRREDVRVTHVVGSTAQKAQLFARRHGLECAAHDRLIDALTDLAVDIVGVFTPNHLHAEQAMAAAEGGKHIIIEKPACLSMKELRAMRTAVKSAGVRTIVGFVLRWNPLLNIIRRSVEAGTLGKVIFAEVDYLHGLLDRGERAGAVPAIEGGGDSRRPTTAGKLQRGASQNRQRASARSAKALRDSSERSWRLSRRTAGTSLLVGGCHAVDAIRYLVGRPVVEVSAYSTTRTKVLEYPGTEIALLKFDDGTVGKVASCLECNMPYVFNVELFGTAGTFRNNQFAGDIFKGQTAFATVPTVLPDSGDVSHHPFDGEINHFIECLNSGKRPMPDIEDAAETMQVCFGAEMSAKRGRAVRLPLK